MIPGVAIVVLGGAAAYAVSRRLRGEARIFGGYFAGFAAGGLIAILAAPGGESQSLLVGLKELVCLAPAFGVGIAEVMKQRAAPIRDRSNPATTAAPVRRAAQSL